MVVRSGLISSFEANAWSTPAEHRRREALTPPSRLRLFGPAAPLSDLGGCMRRWTSSLVGLVFVSTPLAAQGLRDQIAELFIFTAGKDPLFLGGTADPNNPANIRLHANHFMPAARAEHGASISFTGNATSGNGATVPVSATSGGATSRSAAAVAG